MAEAILIVGPSGSGKSASARNLPTESTFYINVIGKNPPFKNEYKKQILNTPPANLSVEQVYAALPNMIEEGVNMVQTDSAKQIEALIMHVDKNMPHIKTLVVDDWQYVAANEYMRKANVKGFDKFTQIGKDIWSTANASRNLTREDLIVYLITHEELITDAEGNKAFKAKTIGKLVDNVLTLEGMFTIVLYAGTELDKDKSLKNYIYTRGNGTNTCKTPIDMFEQDKIPNDLQIVDKKVREFYNI